MLRSNWRSIRSFPAVAFIGCLGCLLAVPARPGDPPPPVDDPVLVNEVTAGRQLNPAAAALPSGDVVVVWAGEDGDGRGIFGRKVDAAGQPTGSEFQVSVATADDQVSAEVAAREDGGFVVVWEFDGPGTSSAMARSFDASGVGAPEFAVGPAGTGLNILDPKIEALSDSTFVVVWDEYDSPQTDGSVRARFLDSSGGAAGGTFEMPTGGLGNNVFGPELARRAADGFLVYWTENDGTSERYVQKFTNAASQDGGEILVGTFTSGRLAGLSDDGVEVVSISANDAQRLRVSPGGTVGPLVDLSPDPSTQNAVDVAALPGNESVVVWTTLPNADPDRIEAQWIDASSSVKAQWEVATSVASVANPRVVYDSTTAQIVVVWSQLAASGGDQDDVLIRRYQLPVDVDIFADGFESGDVSAWSSSSP